MWPKLRRQPKLALARLDPDRARCADGQSACPGCLEWKVIGSRPFLPPLVRLWGTGSQRVYSGLWASGSLDSSQNTRRHSTRAGELTAAETTNQT